ncbi:hypothetical protein PITC_068440 [Penicillium italicum]|uniref:Uncharacterized protein n=1 Tax=Penicillium italicum TaxID=40296 RepID=A0A0A2LGP9_PENIT|nr:hypothetical protein PITC_068440 [Penicillium italicum]
MPTVFSKFADGEILPHDTQLAASAEGHDTQLPSSDEPPMSQAEMEQLQAHEDELKARQLKAHQFLEEALLLAAMQCATGETRVPDLVIPGSHEGEVALSEASKSAGQGIGPAQSSPGEWNSNHAGLTLGNGQLRLKVEHWQTPGPKFAVVKNPTGKPKCDLHGEIASPEMMYVDFKIPPGYPCGMLGVLQLMEALFMSPKAISMSNIEIGSAAARRESRNPKRDSYYINWTTPWETAGCRVSWMKAKEKSPIVKFKFVSGRNAKREEQMIVTVDERDEIYQLISGNDPNSYGKYMALPVRIWLRMQWMISEARDTESKLFGKLLVENNSLSSTKKNKGKKASKEFPESAPEPSTAEEGSCENAKSEVSAMPSPEQSVLGQEHTMETVGSQELTEEVSIHEELTKKESTREELPLEPLAREDFTQHESTQQESTEQKSTPKGFTRGASTLTIDTKKSNRRSKGKRKGKGKRTPGSSGSDTGKKDADHVTDHITDHVKDQRGDNQGDDLLPGVQDIARQDVKTEQQLATVAGQQPVNTPRSPITPNDLNTPFSPSFETARTHFSPHTPHPSSSLSSFFTPISVSRKKEDGGEGEVKAEGNEPAEVSDELCFAPRGDEDGLRCSVSDSGDKVWFSDPEEYLGGHETQESVLRRHVTFDVASLGLSRGQETTSLSPTADPPSTSRASSALSTTDSAGPGTYDPTSDGTAQPGDQSPAESSRSGSKSAYKKRKQERRRRRNLMKRQKSRSADVESPVSSASSQGDGEEGRSPSPPESFEDDEPTPTAKQFGNVGAPAPESQMDLRRVGIVCQEEDCQVICGLGDGVSVVCPKCGPFSLVRYCGKSHLWGDVKRHWEICTMLPVLEQHLAGLIPHGDLVGPPMLPCLHLWDTPERHRQALWFSSARDRGDYFVFEELNNPMEAVDAPASHVGLRCSPRVAHIVRFEDAKEKDRFRRCLAICLFAAVEHPALVDYLYRLVRDWMRAHNMWASDKDMDSMLRHQMGFEMGYTVDENRVGLRHACETEWVGADQRHCEDLTCASERRPTLLGNHRMGLGFQRVCEALESNYWILRAHRATHPSVSDVVARTCGAGFSEVLAMDRRTFRRGVGWDGAGTGPMELEMPWSG